MDLAQLHLLINHLPIFGSIIGALVMAQAISNRSESTNRAALGIFVISAAGAVVAFYTGDAAAERAAGLQGISEAAIEAHEAFAKIALIGMIILGICSLGAYFFSLGKAPYNRKISIAILVLALLGFGLVARTGYLGGEIRHSDIMKKQLQKGSVAGSLQHSQPSDSEDDHH